MKSSENNILPGYVEWLHGLANRYKTSQIKAAIAVNSEMLKFYWSLGADIVRLEPDQPWGSKFMQRLSEDIRREIPDAGCFSCGNLYYMRWFFELYCMRPILPQLGGKLKEREREVRVNCSPSWGIIEVEAQLLFEKRGVIGMEDAP